MPKSRRTRTDCSAATFPGLWLDAAALLRGDVKAVLTALRRDSIVSSTRICEVTHSALPFRWKGAASGLRSST